MAESLVRVAAPVSSRTWQASAYLANFLRGKGACLVPWCTPERAVTVLTSETFRFRVKPRNTAVQRVWMVLLRTTTPSGLIGVLRAPPSTGTPLVITPTTSLDARIPVVYVEDLASKSNSEGEIAIEFGVTNAQAGNVIVEGIACYEQDRPILTMDSTDYGVDVVTCAAAQPMYDGDYASFGGIMDSLANSDARRVGIWHWTVGASALAARSTASYADLLALSVPGLARKLARAATTGTVKWSVYAKMSSAGTGLVRLTSSHSGISDVMSVTSTSYAWTTARTVSIDCDDMSASDGRQGSSWDDLMVSFQGDGTRTLTIQSISIWSDD